MQIGICGGEYEMKIYDISQEVFGCQVYPGDPTPKKRVISSMEKGDLYNLTAFSMCAHNGTHIDAPFFYVELEGHRAHVAYQIHDEGLDIRHTIVPDSVHHLAILILYRKGKGRKFTELKTIKQRYEK